MRRAGYEVRVLPEEDLGWEENPPTLIEFIRRDLRWCQGNMQYWRFLAMPGLKPVSRYQLAFAILMFIGSPAWIGLLVLGTLGAGAAPIRRRSFIRADAGIALFVCVHGDVVRAEDRDRDRRAAAAGAAPAFGGAARFVVNFAIEMAYSILLCPIMWFGHTHLPDRPAVRPRDRLDRPDARRSRGAARAGAAQSVAAYAARLRRASALLAATQPAAIPYALFLAGGPRAGGAVRRADGVACGRRDSVARIGIGRLPEETAPPPRCDALALPRRC